MYSTRGSRYYAIVALALALGCTPLSTKEAQGAKPATPVEITNPNTNPAVTSDIDNPGRAPYQSANDKTGSCSGNLCEFTFTAPAGHRIVVQNISGVVSVITGNLSQLLVSVNAPSGGAITGFTAPAVMHSDFTPFNEQVLFYIDAGQFVTVSIFLQGGATYAGDHNEQVVTLTGYAVDCTVANCAPIVH